MADIPAPSAHVCTFCQASHFPCQECKTCDRCHDRHLIGLGGGLCEVFAETLYKQYLGHGHQAALRAIYLCGYRDARAHER